MNQVLAGGAQVVARAVEHQLRQVASTTAATSATATSGLPTTSSPVSSFIPSITGSSFSPSSVSPTQGAPQPTQSEEPQPQAGTSSPLLFFVALGFGVVFTNLWIIVGVKYCFRYNARNRQLRGLDENGEPINLENMPARPHRRRREKKLMTMDEVNEKFPMVKYKTWVSDRAREGLPTAGGVSLPPSRANSVRSVDGVVPTVPAKEPKSTEDQAKPNTNANASTDVSATATEKPREATEKPTVAPDAKDPYPHASDDEDDEHIDAALPPELMAAAGDTCAICIDTLEDDDDVRGLTCGHAFHAVCLDPWLTNRRACCPLCKADYYTPKPRPPPADGDTNNQNTRREASRNNGRVNLPRAPQRARAPFSSSLLFGGRLGATRTAAANNWASRPTRPERRRAEQQARAPERETAAADQDGWFNRFRGQFPPFRLNQMMRRADGTEPPPAQPQQAVNNASAVAPTPSQLEAGVRANNAPAN
jgi:hypothetical protein